MKKTEKKLIHAIHDATIEGRLKWSLIGNELRTDLPLKDLMGIAEYVVVMQHDDMYTIGIEGETFDYAIHASGRKMRKKIREIFSYASLSDINPQAILSDITNVLVDYIPAGKVRLTHGNGDVTYEDFDVSQCPCDIQTYKAILCE